jgi:hypothetical protein
MSLPKATTTRKSKSEPSQKIMDDFSARSERDYQEQAVSTSAKESVLAAFPEASVSTWKRSHQIVRPRTEQDGKGMMAHIPISSLLPTEDEAWEDAASKIKAESKKWILTATKEITGARETVTREYPATVASFNVMQRETRELEKDGYHVETKKV